MVTPKSFSNLCLPNNLAFSQNIFQLRFTKQSCIFSKFFRLKVFVFSQRFYLNVNQTDQRIVNEKDQTRTLNSQSQSLIPRCHLIMIPSLSLLLGGFLWPKGQSGKPFWNWKIFMIRLGSRQIWQVQLSSPSLFIKEKRSSDYVLNFNSAAFPLAKSQPELFLF